MATLNYEQYCEHFFGEEELVKLIAMFFTFDGRQNNYPQNMELNVKIAHFVRLQHLMGLPGYGFHYIGRTENSAIFEWKCDISNVDDKSEMHRSGCEVFADKYVVRKFEKPWKDDYTEILFDSAGEAIAEIADEIGMDIESDDRKELVKIKEPQLMDILMGALDANQEVDKDDDDYDEDMGVLYDEDSKYTEEEYEADMNAARSYADRQCNGLRKQLKGQFPDKVIKSTMTRVRRLLVALRFMIEDSIKSISIIKGGYIRVRCFDKEYQRADITTKISNKIHFFEVKLKPYDDMPDDVEKLYMKSTDVDEIESLVFDYLDDEYVDYDDLDFEFTQVKRDDE